MSRFWHTEYLIDIATAMASIATPTMVTQRIFNTRLLIYQLTSGLFPYLPTSGLLTSGLIIYLLPVYLLIYLLPVYLLPVKYLLIYLLIYFNLMAYGHTPLFPMSWGILSERQCQKPRGRSATVSYTA